MKWIKIEDGCEMPYPWEYIAVCATCDRTRDWHESFFSESGKFFSVTSDMDISTYVTHWARVELPEE